MAEFTNARLMAIEHPETFSRECNNTLKEHVLEGSYVKVCSEGERFWAKVVNINGDEITATVDNDLIRTDSHGLRYTDQITFTFDHVYDYMD